METKVNVQITQSENPVVTILEGKALTPRERKPINISGTIQSPSEYARVKGINPLKDHVLFSRNNMRIDLFKDNNNELGDKITGTLEINNDLSKFKINQDAKRSTKDMASFLKMNKFFFDDKQEHMKVVSGLANFQAKVNTEIEKEGDNRGNKKDVLVKKITTEIPTSFILNIPVFVGQEAKKFLVEIAIDYTDGNGVESWLESTEMQNIMIEERDSIIDAELSKIKAFGDCPIIETN